MPKPHPAPDGGGLEAQLTALAKMLEDAAGDVRRVVADIRETERAPGADPEGEDDAS